jgi:hypothetical protein
MYNNSGNIGINVLSAQTKLEVFNSVDDDHISSVGSAPSYGLLNVAISPQYHATIGLATATNNFINSSIAGDLVIVNRTTGATATQGSIIFGVSVGSPGTLRVSPLGNIIMGDTSTDTGEELQVNGDVAVSGTLSAASKSFDIPHPTKEGYRLRYGVLEGPEHGVYFRGTTNQNIIILPDYWKELVHYNSYTVTLTPIGKPCQHYVEKVQDHVVYINCECGDINTYFLVQAERKDVDRPKLEYIPNQELSI